MKDLEGNELQVIQHLDDNKVRIYDVQEIVGDDGLTTIELTGDYEDVSTVLAVS